MIDDIKNSNEWKIHLTIKSKFMSPTDSNKKRLMYFRNNGSTINFGHDTDEIIPEVFHLLSNRY